MGVSGFSARPVQGLPEVDEGFKLGAAIAELAELTSGDVVVISQKVVSKAEGRSVDLGSVSPGEEARELAGRLGKDPRLVELILGEAESVVRTDEGRGILITATRHGR